MVDGCYVDLLGRHIDPSGQATWVGQIQAGHRDEKAAGPAGWLGVMQAGMHIEQMQGGFISSPEYYNLGGGTDTGWITRLYQKVLHRTPAPAEVEYWLGRLAHGATRYDVAIGFLYSTEHLTEVVDGYYQLLLHRSIDPSGRQTWVSKIQTGSRDEQIIASIVSSAEYRNNVPGPTTPPNPGGTVSQQNAYRQAQSYLRYMPFSRSGLAGQLAYEGYGPEDSEFAIARLEAEGGVDWNAQAAAQAASYLKHMPFSRSGLYDQLIYEGFTPEQAEYGVSTTGL